jgi:hypothetical protein
MEQEQTKNKVGRPINPIEYKNIDYNNKKYITGKVKTNDTYIYFVIDEEDYYKVKDCSWHFISNNYISHTIPVDDKRRELYLHNMIMNRLGFPGKGSKESVDHINRIGLDNRKENLRVISQSNQNLNQSKKKRRIELPEDSGLVADDIPKHIWYIKPNGSHGERFAIEFKTENIIWKTTASKNILLKDKLESAKEKLAELYKIYPHLNSENEEKLHKIKDLTNSYYEIIKLVNNEYFN